MTSALDFNVANRNNPGAKPVRKLVINWETGEVQFGKQTAQLHPHEAGLLNAIQNPISYDFNESTDFYEETLCYTLGYENIDEFKAVYDSALKKLDDIVIANDGGDGGVMHECEDGTKVAVPRAYDFTLKAHHLFFVTEEGRHGFLYELHNHVMAGREVSDQKMAAIKPPLKSSSYALEL